MGDRLLTDTESKTIEFSTKLTGLIENAIKCEKDWDRFRALSTALIAGEVGKLFHHLAALEARLAVLGKVEEEVKKHGEIRFAEFSDGFFVILQERSSDPFQCEAFGNSFLEAFAALVDGKDGG
jgi:hypothetical protein